MGTEPRDHDDDGRGRGWTEPDREPRPEPDWAQRARDGLDYARRRYGGPPFRGSLPDGEPRVYGAAPGSDGRAATPGDPPPWSGHRAPNRHVAHTHYARIPGEPDEWTPVRLPVPSGGEAGAARSDHAAPLAADVGPPRCPDCGREHAWSRLGVVRESTGGSAGLDLRGAVAWIRPVGGERCERCQRRGARQAFVVAVREAGDGLREYGVPAVRLHVRGAERWARVQLRRARHARRVAVERWGAPGQAAGVRAARAVAPLVPVVAEQGRRVVERGLRPVVEAAGDVVAAVVPYVTRWDFARWLIRQVIFRQLPVRGAWRQWTNNPRQDAYGRRAARRRARFDPARTRVGPLVWIRGRVERVVPEARREWVDGHVVEATVYQDGRIERYE